MIVSATKSKSKPKPATSEPCAAPIRGVIRIGEIYTLSTFRRILGIEAWAMRSMRKAGLRVRRIGNLRLVSGADFAEFVAAASEGGEPG